ncbi:MAG TPA: PilT/PilU family type 4a pilus ATPase, partial [Fibrobacteria bacterium]|nr:PilT/PilU family type 4a pilus ATPase [Fibrobacteria bacterium]
TAKGGSDLHLEQGRKPKVRVNGDLEVLESFPALSEEHMRRMLEEIAGRDRWDRFESSGDLDFAYALGDEARFRANYLQQATGYGAVFRIIPSRILSLEKLEAPEVLSRLIDFGSGLILVTGPTGSGKSTTLAAIIDHINANHCRKIVTIEEPVEFVHRSRQSIIIHREVGPDTSSFMAGLKGALRSDVNIVLVGEMRDKETIELALTAAEMGILVFGTLHTNSAAKTIDRIIDVFPARQKNQIRSQLANTLRAVVSQQLVKSADGQRRWAAQEILLSCSALGGIIRSGETIKLNSMIQTNRGMGMQTMDDCLMDMVKTGKISMEAAFMKALDKSRFRAA